MILFRTKLFCLLLGGLLAIGTACRRADNGRLQAETGPHDLVFDRLAASWDEALQLGNAFVGELIWQRDSMLRMSLDRIDLWDTRPTDSLSGDRFRFDWVYRMWQEGSYSAVQRKFDEPYDRLAAPSKIPGAAIEFDVRSLGSVRSARLVLADALAEVEWEGGASLQSFVSATEPVGWFRFEGVTPEILPEVIAPRYQLEGELAASSPVGGHDLRRLEYEQGQIEYERRADGGTIRYRQPGYGDFYYDVAVEYRFAEGRLIGAWSITTSGAASAGEPEASELAAEALRRGIRKDYENHRKWWAEYWSRSSVTLPDKVLERQYANEIYKFGCVTRRNSPIIPLQGVWTADNGLLPPWKGDVHHDLNTQLSYWPCYTGNHLDEGFGYLQTLWDQRDVNREYTRQYFGCEGLNVPGVATIEGRPMGGWIQYALSQTVSAWLGHHFYLHWKYSADPDFLREMGYPYLREVATFLEQITVKNERGERTLRISSSPEINDNTPQAWFPTITNYDLALLRSAFREASEMADALELKEESAHWAALEAELPPFDLDSTGALTFAAGSPYDQSHRHFSNALAIHPLSLLDVTHGADEERIVRATIDRFDEHGSSEWVGYTFCWLANMKARALDGEGAAAALRDFADYFCLPNTFHANGQQNGMGKSNFTYRPFTLEGNFAFAAGIQEMLLQSHTGIVRLFPAIPASWRDVSFRDLRAQGAFLISATMTDGRVTEVTIDPTMGGTLKLANPFPAGASPHISGAVSATLDGGVWTIETRKGKPVRLRP